MVDGEIFFIKKIVFKENDWFSTVYLKRWKKVFDVQILLLKFIVSILTTFCSKYKILN